MKAYLDIVKKIMDAGEYRGDRTGTGTKSYFGTHFEHDCRDGFPLVTHKKVGTKSVFAELVWFLAGNTNSHDLEKLGSSIWKEFAAPNGDIGPMYGAAWRGRQGHPVDQLADAIRLIKFDPMSRRICVNAWKPELLPDTTMSPSENAAKGRMALAPCHVSYQFFVGRDDSLHLSWEQRSADTALGIPYNIASYAGLLHLVAYLTDLTPGRLIGNFGDTHLYNDHINEGHVETMLARQTHPLPTMSLEDSDTLHDARQIVRHFDKTTPVSMYGHLLDTLFIDNAEEMIDVLRQGIKNYTHEATIKMNVSV